MSAQSNWCGVSTKGRHHSRLNFSYKPEIASECAIALRNLGTQGRRLARHNLKRNRLLRCALIPLGTHHALKHMARKALADGGLPESIQVCNTTSLATPQ